MSELMRELGELEIKRSKLIAKLKQVRDEMDKLRADAASLVLSGSDIGEIPVSILKLETLEDAIVTAVKQMDRDIRIARELVLAEEQEQATAAAHAALLEQQEAWRYR